MEGHREVPLSISTMLPIATRFIAPLQPGRKLAVPQVDLVMAVSAGVGRHAEALRVAGIGAQHAVLPHPHDGLAGRAVAILASSI